MSDLDALLAGIITDPHNALRWLVVADWLDDHDQPERAELLRLHRELIRTCCVPGEYPERGEWQRRVVELIDQGVKPCVPQHTLMLPGGVPLIGSFIPPGSFLMGGTENIDEKPIHTVTLTQGFFLGICPVTQQQWEAVLGGNPRRPVANRRPVTKVSWNDAADFCVALADQAKHRVRLPTEAEWEFACRAGTTTHFHFGDVPSTKRVNYDGSRSWNGSKRGTDRHRTTDVDQFPPNAWGLFDCHGNVWEWCADWFDSQFYAGSPEEDPRCRNLSRTHLSLRGGSWHSYANRCRAAFRNGGEADDRDNDIGLRVAFTLT